MQKDYTHLDRGLDLPIRVGHAVRPDQRNFPSRK